MAKHLRAIGRLDAYIYPLRSNHSLGTSCTTLAPGSCEGETAVVTLLRTLWFDERGQDVAEYAVMLAVVLVIVLGTVRLIGSNANTIFSQVSSAIQ